MDADTGKCCICDNCDLWPCPEGKDGLLYHYRFCFNFDLCEACHYRNGFGIPSWHLAERKKDAILAEKDSSGEYRKPLSQRASDVGWSYRGQEALQDELDRWPRRYINARDCYVWMQDLALFLPSSTTNVVNSSRGGPSTSHSQVGEALQNVESEDIAGPHAQNGNLEHVGRNEHQVFFSYTKPQRDFAEQLSVDLVREGFGVFFDKKDDSLPKAKLWLPRILEALECCELGVVVISDEYFQKAFCMLELATFGKRNKKLLPIFYKLSCEECKEKDRRSKWQACWKDFGVEFRKAQDWQEWYRLFPQETSIEKLFEEALERLLKFTGNISYDKKKGEVAYREEIKEDIRKEVRIHVAPDDPSIQGSLRLSKIIERELRVDDDTLPQFIGMYGMGGMGKTILSKTVCKHLYNSFHGRAYHVELGSKDSLTLQRDLLREVTKNNAWLVDQATTLEKGHDLLSKHLTEDAVFLVLDNVWDNTSDALKEVNRYLNMPFKTGSIVLATARTKEILSNVPEKMKWKKLFEMPSLEFDEARDLFLQSARCRMSELSPTEIEDLNKLMRECYFSERAGEESKLHPLTIEVLGAKIGKHRTKWKDTMNILMDTIRNSSDHKLYTCLKLGYKDLSDQHQQMFFDLVLRIGVGVAGPTNEKSEVEAYHFFRKVYSEDDGGITDFLQVLQDRGLVKRGTSWAPWKGFNAWYVHDLYMEVVKWEETRRGLRHENWCALRSSGVSMRGRLVVQNQTFTSLGKDNLCSICSEAEVLIIYRCENLANVDVRRMRNLSLFQVRYIGCSTLSKINVENVHTLQDFSLYSSIKIFEVPNLEGLISLKRLSIRGPTMFEFDEGGCSSGGEIEGSCQELNLADCKALEFIHLCNILGLTKISHWEELKCLSILQLWNLPDLVELPSFVGFKSLTILRIRRLKRIERLVGLEGLQKLGSFYIKGCPLLADISGIEHLVELVLLGCWDTPLIRGLPDLSGLHKLQRVYFVGCSGLTSLEGLGTLRDLRRLDVSNCKSLVGLPDLRGSPLLTELTMSYTSVSEIPHIEHNGWLEYLFCAKSRLKSLPNLRKLQRLKVIDLSLCSELHTLPRLLGLPALETLDARGCPNLKTFPDLSGSTALKELYVSPCVDPNSVKLPGQHIQLPREEEHRAEGCHKEKEAERRPREVELTSKESSS